MPRVSSHTSWQPLEEVVVGRAYSPDYFDFIEDAQVRNQLQQILAETAEDLDNLQKTIERYGAIVQRPDLPDKDRFQKFQTFGRPIPLPPLTPRDWQITLGETLLRILPLKELDHICDQYGDQVRSPHHDHGIRHVDGIHDPDCVLVGASASCIVRVGLDVFFDNSDYLRPDQTQWIVDNCLSKQHRVHEAVTDGHGDAVFAILKPGVILSSKHDENLHFDRDFPGWEVLRVLDSSIDAAIAMGQFKNQSNAGAWYIQGQTPSDNFKQYVDTYLTKWTGFVAETVFDVNCLVLDEQNVIFSAYNKSVFDFCQQHKINPIISELRHSYFWDGGISCCTQDIRRRGGLERYL
jgi:hypothetical protein